MTPWSWRPSSEGWFDRLAERAQQWTPAAGLELNTAAIRAALVQAAQARAGWLFHPCTAALTRPHPRAPMQRDLQLAAWLATSGEYELGDITITEPMWLWTASGGAPLEPGRRSLARLGAELASVEAPVCIALDVWSRSFGEVQPGSWACLDSPLSQELHARLQHEIVLFLRAIGWVSTRLPECAAWFAAVTRVAVPLHHEGGATFRSGSTEDLPGVIYLDLFGGAAQILEAVVHESAHHHLYLAEVDSPLVEPSCDQRFHSPLRPEPRPLRGIIMAYHALAYICCFYREAVRAGAPFAEQIAGERDSMLDRLATGEQVLADNIRYLTPAGQEFFRYTMEVANHARS